MRKTSRAGSTSAAREKGRKKPKAKAKAKAPGAAAAAAAGAPDGRARAPKDGGKEALRRAEERVAELEEELARAREEIGAVSDRALRTLAEFGNYRRRSERERRDALADGAANVLGELLTVVDDFDRALEHAGGEVPEAFLEGMRLVARGLHDLLDRHGIARIESVGTPFDPEVHEALSSLPSDGAEPNTVLEEVQAGYRLGEKVLRPARVVVARAAQPQSPGGEGPPSGQTPSGS